MRKGLLFTTFCCAFIIASHAKNLAPSPAYKIFQSERFMQAKNYCLLPLFRELGDVSALLTADPKLQAILQDKRTRLSAVLVDCENDVRCFTGGMKFSASEIQAVFERLMKLYKKDNALGALIKEHLVSSCITSTSRAQSYHITDKVQARCQREHINLILYTIEKNS